MGNLTQIGIVVVATVLLITGMHSQACGEQAERVITIKGPESMAPMVESMAKEFMKTKPDCVVKIASTGEMDGKAFVSNESDVTVTPRRILDGETKEAVGAGLDPQEKMIDWGAIAIVVHPSNPLNELTKEQVRNIFAGRVENWTEIGGINRAVSVLSVPQEPATVDYFERNILEWPISSGAVAKDSFASVIDTVSMEPGFIGYIRLRKLEHLDQNSAKARIKVLSIKRDEKSSPISPSKETVASGAYPLMRPYYLYVDRNAPSEHVKAFVEFCAIN